MSEQATRMLIKKGGIIFLIRSLSSCIISLKDWLNPELGFYFCLGNKLNKLLNYYLRKIIQSWNILLWKGPTRITEPSGLHTGPPSIQTPCLGALSMLLELRQLSTMTAALGSLFHAHHPLVQSLSSYYPTWPSPLSLAAFSNAWSISS